MILDNERQRDALLQLIKTSTFSGDQIEFVHELYQAIRAAHVTPAAAPFADSPAGLTSETPA